MSKARDILIALWKKNNGCWEGICDDLVNKIYPQEIETEGNDKYITILDDDYPEELKIQFKPPFVLVRK